ncbi:MAG: hypothetical protein IKY99_10615 [Bacteroidaceae bacterium]|nr:hypothetical protein [Bacteroidaceae bacterium]MBR5613518.1 hypothetical protein [Bacteroidaceae bacterium]
MKKNLVKMMLAAIVVLASGVNIYNSQKVSGMSDVVLANVDALADGEYSGDNNCHEIVLAAPNDDSLAVWAVWCQECKGMWAISAYNSGHC